jgi:GNAT superfamily N-acetyltransferase
MLAGVIRAASLDDAPAVADLMAAVHVEFPTTADAIRHWMTTHLPEEHQASWCAQEPGGAVVGWATTGIDLETSTPGVAWVGVSVRQDRRGRGLGTALWELAEGHARSVGARRLLCRSRGDEASLRFMTGRGLTRTAEEETLVVDPRTVEPAAAPDGVELVPFRQLGDDPSPVFALEAETVIDMPSEEPIDSMAYETWVKRYWSNPLLDLEASIVALDRGQPAAYSRLYTNRSLGRGFNAGTGTLRSHRGRGLATLAKRASLARAGELGLTAVYTGNDATNAPMLAINRRLGYRPADKTYMWVVDVAATNAASG